MVIISFPNHFDAPNKLLQLESNCGLITAWCILKYFKKRTSSEKLIKLCRYTKKHGTFTIALAVALKKHGLNVTFFSDTDPKPHLIENQSYRIAKNIGVNIQPAIRLELLLESININKIAAVLYNTAENYGHLTPLLGINGNNLILPYSDEGFMLKQEFLVRWNEPEIYRQSLIVSL